MNTLSAAWPRTADRSTLASAATAATGFSPGLEVTLGLRLAHSVRLQVTRNPRPQAGQQLPARLDGEFLRLAEGDEEP